MRFALSTAAFLTAVCTLLPVFQVTVSAATEAKPNVIFILTDDQRLEDINHMPILQRLLIQEGMSFDDYYANVSLCCPSRASILRGQFAHNTGVLTNGGSNGGYGVFLSRRLEDSTIAVWLHDHGYKTALIGKYLNGYPGNLGPRHVPPGWDFWASPVKGNPYGQYNYTLNENGSLVEYGNQPKDYGTDVYTDKAVNFIEDCHSTRTPFFIYLAFYAPHAPATPAPRHAARFQNVCLPRTPAFNEADVSAKPQFIRNLPPMTTAAVASADAFYARRLACLQAVDDAIDTICQTLAKTGQLDNTYIVFASDNGFHLGEHRLIRGKRTAYETDTHVPLIVRGPGIAKGATSKALAGNIDLAPTFAELVGAAAPNFIDGRSLAAILKGQTGKNWRQAFLIEHWRQDAEPTNEKLGEEIMQGRKVEALIPQFNALQGADGVFVQYVTGEREYYQRPDVNQVSNLSGKVTKEELDSKAAQAQRLSGSAAEQARRLECSK